MENKNLSSASENRHHHKNKSRKHKSYFLTPAESNSNDISTTPSSNEQKNSAPSPRSKHNTPNNDIHQERADSPMQNQQPKGNRHRNRRKRHGERNQGSQNLNTTTNEHTTKEFVNEPKLDSSTQISSDTTKKSDRLEKIASKPLERFSNTPEFEKYSEYKEFSYEELYGKDDFCNSPAESSVNTSQAPEPTADEPMVSVVGVRFKASGKTYFFDPRGIFFKLGAHAIVETSRGLEYGEIALPNTKVKASETVAPLRPVIRVATEADIKHHAENKEKENEAFRLCNEKILEHNLEMKLIDAQYTFDNSKLLFYFTSSGRVDFRELVKDLAGVFRTRIELRQIGIRDEAKMVGGLGLCGRPLCCSLFLTDFGQVSIKMAKEQNLSLNSSKISGICGRLMCCLRYEHETYEYEIKRTPPIDTLVRTADGVGVVTEISPLAGTIKVRLNESPDVPPKAYKREDVSILKKNKQ